MERSDSPRMEITQAAVSAAVRTERENLVSYLEQLPGAAWDKPSLCEGWRVRDVVAHLVGNAADIVAQRLEGAGSAEFNQRQVDERSGRTPAELLSEWKEQGGVFEQTMAALPDEMWGSQYPPFGTVGEALQRIVEDLWVHAQDIRVALGEDPVEGPGLEATFDVLEREAAERFPRLAPGVGKIQIETDGTTRSVDLGDGEPVRISGDPAAIALVATGRVPLETATKEGSVAVTPAPPEGFADAFNIYGP